MAKLSSLGGGDKPKERKTKKPPSKRNTHPNNEKKHDWGLIKALYMAGMEPSQILKLPEGKALSKSYFLKRMSMEKWPAERRAIRGRRDALIGQTLEQRIEKAIRAHHDFLLKEIEDEREILAHRVKTSNIADQKERIDLLQKYLAITSKALGLEDGSPVNHNKNSYNILLAVQNPKAAQELLRTLAGVQTLGENKNAPAGILGPAKGILESDQIIELPADQPAAPPNQNNQPADQPADQSPTSPQKQNGTLSPTITAKAEMILATYRKGKANGNGKVNAND